MYRLNLILYIQININYVTIIIFLNVPSQNVLFHTSHYRNNGSFHLLGNNPNHWTQWKPSLVFMRVCVFYLVTLVNQFFHLTAGVAMPCRQVACESNTKETAVCVCVVIHSVQTKTQSVTNDHNSLAGL